MPELARMKYLCVCFLLLTSVVWADDLFELVDQNRVSKVNEILIEFPELVNKKQQNVSLLHVACFKGSEPMAKMLLENGADIDAEDMLGSSPLYRALANEHAELALFLIAEGADLDHADKTGVTPFMAASCVLEVAALSSLIEREADLEREDHQ